MREWWVFRLSASMRLVSKSSTMFLLNDGRIGVRRVGHSALPTASTFETQCAQSVWPHCSVTGCLRSPRIRSRQMWHVYDVETIQQRNKKTTFWYAGHGAF